MLEFGQDSLLTLAAVVREGTFDAAAEALHITPSAVSQRIKALEAQVGRVVVRRTKPVTATADGQVLVRLARQWELLTAEAHTELLGGRGERVHLPIAANADSLATWLLPVLADLHRDHAVAVEVMRDDESRNADFLRSGEVLGAITSAPADIRGCTVVSLGAMRYLPVATPDYVQRYFPGGVDERSLRQAPVIRFDRSDDIQWAAIADTVGGHVNPPTVYIPASTEFNRAVELGIGWGTVPSEQATPALADGRLVRLPMRPVDVPLFWQYWKLSSPVLQSLTDLMVAARGD